MVSHFFSSFKIFKNVYGLTLKLLVACSDKEKGRLRLLFFFFNCFEKVIINVDRKEIVHIGYKEIQYSLGFHMLTVSRILRDYQVVAFLLI